MKWLTEKEVVTAAKKSEKAAIACSEKHWEQNYTATEEEARDMGEKMAIWYFCALCLRYDDDCENGCPLNSPRCLECCKEYRVAHAALENWLERNGRFSTWQAKAKLMYDKLCSL